MHWSTEIYMAIIQVNSSRMVILYIRGRLFVYYLWLMNDDLTKDTSEMREAINYYLSSMLSSVIIAVCMIVMYYQSVFMPIMSVLESYSSVLKPFTLYPFLYEHIADVRKHSEIMCVFLSVPCLDLFVQHLSIPV